MMLRMERSESMMLRMEQIRRERCEAIFAARMCDHCFVKADYCKVGTVERRSRERRIREDRRGSDSTATVRV
jgi:hypothetical protein